MDNQEQINQLDHNIKKSDSYLGTLFAMAYVLVGILIGVSAMYFSHKDIYSHYNICQEQVLKETVARLGSEKTWYIKEDKTGRMKLIELSKHELDSLSK